MKKTPLLSLSLSLVFAPR
uniref:BabB n=1 Tax=Helicobacter pylori TaxID=210 RepID=A0A0N9EJ59_HELPX|nr:BabB [Helicobacter pylori]